MAMRIPERLSFEEAAALPEAFLTAYLNLFTLGSLLPGEAVLIHAGASGIGTAAIQLARAAGARVLTTAGSDEKLMRCRELGAHVTINYKTESFRERVLEATGGRGVDLVLDFIGAPYWEDNLASLGLDGRLALIGFLAGSRGQLDLGMIIGKRLNIFGTTLRRTPLPQKIALTEAVAAFALPRFDTGELHPVIDSVLPLEQAAEAHRRMEGNGTIGKIVLRI
jgi:NADPH:quinone reductase-like Zn-dependent oxidoreductase